MNFDLLLVQYSGTMTYLDVLTYSSFPEQMSKTIGLITIILHVISKVPRFFYFDLDVDPALWPSLYLNILRNIIKTPQELDHNHKKCEVSGDDAP